MISPESGVRFKTVCQALRLIPNTDLNEQIEDPHYLQDGTKEGFLLVPANSNEYQEGQDPQRFFTRAPQNHHPLKKRYTIAFPGLGPSMTSWHASVEPSLTLLRYAALTPGGTRGIKKTAGTSIGINAVSPLAKVEQERQPYAPPSYNNTAGWANTP